jgi:hypothetical protein
MRCLSICSALIILVLAAGVPCHALTLDEIIDQHIAAHGGRESWQAVTSMRITGSYTAFSRVKPFTLVRTQDRRYLMDHYQDDKHVVIGYDGEQAWWLNPWYGIDWAIPITGPDRIALERSLDFYPSPLFDYQEQGFEVELADTTELDGRQVLQIKVTRSDGSEETWYLDSETYLEVACDSPGSDFGTPFPQRTYFDDFREVGDLVIAHYVESEWYTRSQVMEIDTIELDVDVAGIRFAPPPPTGMDRLLPLAGTWSVKVEDRPGAGGAARETMLTMTITSRIGGALLEAHYTNENGIDVISSLTYDRFRKCYRLTRIDSFMTYLDIQEGSFEEGQLKLDAGPDTSFQMDGRTFHQATVIRDITEDGFVEERLLRIGDNETWITNQRLTYTRIGGAAASELEGSK